VALSKVSRPAALLGVAGLVLSVGLRAAAPLHVVGPPPGHTGGFGEPTCVVCHVGSDINEPGSELEVTGLDNGYRPGATYRVTVRLLSFDMNTAGFQGAFRWAAGDAAGTTAGAVRALDDRVATTDSTGVEYVQHAAGGTAANGESAEWAFEWTAPAVAGTVAFHVAANSGSGDNSPLEDLVYTRSVLLEPGGLPPPR
jgi:hypothetical protein